jgi:putative mRNA 3-end processing factor
MPLLEVRSQGIYCPPADVFLDPHRAVSKAIISHAHSDHARWGMQHYIAPTPSVNLIKARIGKNISIAGFNYGEEFTINGVKFSFHPAGHIPGSAQIRVEYHGEIWVYTGDFKWEVDGVSEPFYPVQCHTLITECTFGFPVFQWRKQDFWFQQMGEWWQQNQEDGKNSVVLAYSLGKAQRILKNIPPCGNIYVHPAVAEMNTWVMELGVNFQPWKKLNASDKPEKSLIILPPSGQSDGLMKRLGDVEIGMASGWMGVRGKRSWSAVDRGFALSDHSDWQGIIDLVDASQAETIFATHGNTDVLVRYLKEKGKDARAWGAFFEREEG